MDVEDPINPLADDAALDLALLFTRAGVRGSFCVTGEKCRTLLQRGRRDVIEAFEPHCLGLHTDTHSFHPTTMELLADVDYEEGCRLAFEAESTGFEAFRGAFGRAPAFWGGAGNTWSAEIPHALGRLGIPAYAYPLTRLPGGPVHRFNEVLAFPQTHSISELDWINDERASTASQRVLEGLRACAQPWAGVFVGHPTKLRHNEYWDTPYFAGRTPPGPEYVEPHSVNDYERSKRNLCRFLHHLRDEFETAGLDDVISRRWSFHKPSLEERAYFQRESAAAIRSAAKWPVHRPGLDPENLVRKTLALTETVEIAVLN